MRKIILHARHQDSKARLEVEMACELTQDIRAQLELRLQDMENKFR